MSNLWDAVREWNAENERRLGWYNEYSRGRKLTEERERAAKAPKPIAKGLLDVKLDAPTTMESMGRGITDLWEPVKQGYLNFANPEEANAYRERRAEDERLYHTGLLGRAPRPGERVPVDMARLHGRVLPLVPLLPRGLTAEALGSQMLSFNALDTLNEVRKRLGLGE